MTLKTLKPKTSISLILDNEFLEYCKLNNIEDIEKLAKEVFKQGFTILKYGKEPLVQHVLLIETTPSKNEGNDKTEILVPKGLKSQMEQKSIENMKKKSDLYDE